MLHKTRAVVLKTIKFKESSIVTTLYTDKFGAKAYIVNNVRTKKPRHSMALFQPLSLLELVVYNKENANINRISEIKPASHLTTIPYDHIKTTQVLFLSEILARVIREEEPSHELFEFIFSSIELFDHLEGHYENFHMQFLLKLSKYLGFAAESYHPLIRDHLDEERGQLLSKLLHSPYDASFQLSKNQRTMVLDDILRFYKNQTDVPSELKSLKVLRDLYS